ncbi:MAG TPA: AAA family ATPase [Herpetosiphonaceae bacterium]
MLTRLKVSGFKNLVDVDVHFGPFTCIAGVNGIGKSNLFDAIQFLSATANASLFDAASSVRNDEKRNSDIKNLFSKNENEFIDKMIFEAEMIIPQKAFDDLGQEATASITFLKYTLIIGYRLPDPEKNLGPLEILKEELVHIKKGEAHKHLLFPHKPSAWRNSVVIGKRHVSHFISTEDDGPNRKIKLHQDGGSSGRPRSLSATNLPRTVLSATDASESPTALVVRREMQSWRLLQLEPSALRKPDDFHTPNQYQLGSDGSHLPATLYHLARSFQRGSVILRPSPGQIYSQIANRLSVLLDDVGTVQVDRDEKRELYTLQVTDRTGTTHPARALSDGTLRFLALAVLELEPNSQGLLCFEEPENGIHPARIPAMLRLLQDIATDPNESIGLDNPLRQVIINTHSPAVVAQVPDDSLLVAENREIIENGRRFKAVRFSPLPDTWRQKHPDMQHNVARGKLAWYLNPVDRSRQQPYSPQDKPQRRVVDREDLQLMIPGFGDSQ